MVFRNNGEGRGSCIVHVVGVVVGGWVGLCDKDIFGGGDVLEGSRFWEGTSLFFVVRLFRARSHNNLRVP
jgi:hypothetical protein